MTSPNRPTGLGRPTGTRPGQKLSAAAPSGAARPAGASRTSSSAPRPAPVQLRPAAAPAGAVPGPAPRRPVRPLSYSGPVRKTRSSVVQKEYERQALIDWLTPVIMLGVSALVIMVVPLIYAGEFDIALLAGMGIAVLVIAVVKTVIALVMALAVALLFGTGFDAFWRSVLKLGAIVMTATAVGSLVQFMGCFAIFVYIGVLVSLMMGMMDLERGEAIGFAIVFIIAEAAFWFFLAATITSVLG